VLEEQLQTTLQQQSQNADARAHLFRQALDAKSQELSDAQALLTSLNQDYEQLQSKYTSLKTSYAQLQPSHPRAFSTCH
jgi:hypothetical protein